MLIRLRIDDPEPPQGEVVADGGQSAPFSGWLDLMRVLADLLEDTKAATPRPS